MPQNDRYIDTGNRSSESLYSESVLYTACIPLYALQQLDFDILF